MKNKITELYNNVKEIIERYNMTEEEQRTILGAVEELAYEWCECNAVACATEAVMDEDYPAVHEQFMHSFLKSRTYHAVYQQKMRDTLPEFDGEDD